MSNFMDRDLPPLQKITDVRDELAWAAVCLRGTPRPFIITSSVYWRRDQVMEDLGKVHKARGETDKEGWKRAYKRGWRAMKVNVRLCFTNQRVG